MLTGMASTQKAIKLNENRVRPTSFLVWIRFGVCNSFCELGIPTSELSGDT